MRKFFKFLLLFSLSFNGVVFAKSVRDICQERAMNAYDNAKYLNVDPTKLGGYAFDKCVEEHGGGAKSYEGNVEDNYVSSNKIDWTGIFIPGIIILLVVNYVLRPFFSGFFDSQKKEDASSAFVMCPSCHSINSEKSIKCTKCNLRLPRDVQAGENIEVVQINSVETNENDKSTTLDKNDKIIFDYYLTVLQRVGFELIEEKYISNNLVWIFKSKQGSILQFNSVDELMGFAKSFTSTNN